MKPRRGVSNKKRDKQPLQQCITRSSNSSPTKHPHVNNQSHHSSSQLLIIADATLPWVVTIFSLAVFIPNCSPGIPGGDSGELLAQACQLGTTHPPGILLT